MRCATWRGHDIHNGFIVFCTYLDMHATLFLYKELYRYTGRELCLGTTKTLWSWKLTRISWLLTQHTSVISFVFVKCPWWHNVERDRSTKTLNGGKRTCAIRKKTTARWQNSNCNANVFRTMKSSNRLSHERHFTFLGTYTRAHSHTNSTSQRMIDGHDMNSDLLFAQTIVDASLSVLKCGGR